MRLTDLGLVILSHRVFKLMRESVVAVCINSRHSDAQGVLVILFVFVLPHLRSYTDRQS